MRKNIKSKEQSDNNSQIFKEAKRRFHYEPTHKQQKYFLHSKQKHQKSHQLKDDFSSVKQMKNENNQINQSSWIVKLVNVMHQNSEEDLKMQPSNEAHNFLTLRPVESNMIEAAENHPKPKKTAQIVVVKEQAVATKKNSYNICNSQITNKKSKRKRTQSCDTASKGAMNKYKPQKSKRSKNEVNINRHSHSLLSPPQQQKQNIKEKSKDAKSLNPSKVTSQKIKIIPISNTATKNKKFTEFDSKQSLQTSKQGHQCTQPKASLYTSKQVENSKDYQKRVEHKIEEQNSFCELNKKVDNILAQQICEDLFAPSTIHKNTTKTETHLVSEKRCQIGSIKKNRPFHSQAKLEGTQKQVKKDDVLKKLQFNKEARVEEDEDIVTARQEQVLIEKYLNNDYSFKKQSNMFKCEYPTSDFERQSYKPSINVERPPNTAKITRSSLPVVESKYSTSNRGQFEELSRKQGRKFSYLQTNQKQTTQNSLSLQILTLRCQPQTPKLQEVEKQSFPNFRKKDPITYSKPNIQEDLRRIHQKYNYQNKQNQIKVEPKKGSISTLTTKRENAPEAKVSMINRNPYLQQSLCKADQANTIQRRVSPRLQRQRAKVEYIVPNKQQYIEVSSNLDNINSISKRQRSQSDLFSEPQSEQLITRLNSKLNSYISHYGLERTAEQQCASQPTHRKMKLSFNELKKHHDFFHR